MAQAKRNPVDPSPVEYTLTAFGGRVVDVPGEIDAFEEATPRVLR